MPSANQAITISSLRGGLSDNDPALSLSEDSCTLAENVEFFYSTIGERRLGCTAISLPTAITGDTSIQAVTWMGVNYPTSFLGDAEFWALGQNLTSQYYTLQRRTKTAWSTITPDDAIVVTSSYGHRLSSASLHSKFFLGFNSAVDFLHVWDGTNLRAVGMPAPVLAPTGANTGSGSFASTRYYRVRYIGAPNYPVIARRSEPSPVLTFAPSGSGTGVVVTKPAAVNRGETHWELEASVDNANFYVIATTVVGTTTATDSQAFTTAYVGGVLSELLTAYTQIPSGKYLVVDSDRLLIAGSWTTAAYGSRVWWTPTAGSFGVGNDERLDMTVNPFIDLDGSDGGDITGMSTTINGYLYVFKWGHIYKVLRTGQLTGAYSAFALTKSRGAIPGSLVSAVDADGNPAQYFLDPTTGPMRIGSNGLEWCGRDVRRLWSRVNLDADVPAHGVFYQAKNQVHFWVALDGANYPNAKIILHCDQVRSRAYSDIASGNNSGGARRGWVTVPVGDRIADAHCSCMFSVNIDSTDIRGQTLVPFIGKQTWMISGTTITDIIQRCDTGTTDCFTAGDTNAYYYGVITSKAFSAGGLLNRFGVTAGSAVAVTVPDATNNVYISLIKNFGQEVVTRGLEVEETEPEDIILHIMDNLSVSECTTVQISFGDLNTNIYPTTSWRIHMFSAKVRSEQSS